MLNALLAPRSIRRRLALIVLAGIASATLLIACVTGWQIADRRYTDLKHELESVAATLASAIARPQARQAYRNVQDTLRAIDRMPRVRLVQVFHMNGELTAAFGTGVVLGRDARLLSASDKPSLMQLLKLRSYLVEAPIIQSGREVGRLQLVADVSDLRSALVESLGSSLLLGLIAAIIGFWVAMRLESTLTGPIVGLTDAMREVRSSHDFTRQVPRTSDDEVGHLVDAFNDMLHEIRTRDAKLVLHRNTLEQQIEERTRDLSIATESARKANLAKSSFLATMSHEIRTPMNGILVMAELLAASDLPPQMRRKADVIVASGKTLLSIINDILDFSKIEAGRLELDVVAMQPRTLLDDVTRLFAEQAASKGLDLAGYVGPDVPTTIMADPVRLNQVLCNLVSNALKFTDRGGVSVRITREEPNDEEPSQARLCFEVSDNGIGIAEDKLSVIFDAFSQADQSTTRRFGGSGIGLAICRRLAHAMGGTIDAKSKLGEGATFALSASFDVVDPAAIKRETSRGTEGSERCVLLMLPQGATREALADYAAACGFDVAISESDSQPAAQQCAPSAIIIGEDLNWRRMQPDVRDVPVVVVGSTSFANETTDDTSTGADLILSWPLVSAEVEQLFGALRDGPVVTLNKPDTIESADRRHVVFPGVRVLAADDSPLNQEVLIEALKRLQIDVTTVENGLEAVEARSNERFDLIFMDGSMPGLDGYEAAQRIREWEKTTGRSRVPIVALTAHVVGSQADLWEVTGMDDCVRKPFTLDILEKCLSRLLPEHRRDVVGGMVELDHRGKADSCSEQGVEGSAGHQGHSAEEPVNGQVLIDTDTIASIRSMQGGESDLLCRLYDLYRKHAPIALETLRSSMSDGCEKSIAEAAHALKSLSRNIGAVQVGDICEGIEGAARESKEQCDIGVLQRLSATLTATIDHIEALEKNERHRAAG